MIPSSRGSPANPRARSRSAAATRSDSRRSGVASWTSGSDSTRRTSSFSVKVRERASGPRRRRRARARWPSPGSAPSGGRLELAGAMARDVDAAFGGRRDRTRVGGGTRPPHGPRRSDLRGVRAQLRSERAAQEPPRSATDRRSPCRRPAPVPWGRESTPAPRPSELRRARAARRARPLRDRTATQHPRDVVQELDHRGGRTPSGSGAHRYTSTAAPNVAAARRVAGVAAAAVGARDRERPGARQHRKGERVVRHPHADRRRVATEVPARADSERGSTIVSAPAQKCRARTSAR